MEPITKMIELTTPMQICRPSKISTCSRCGEQQGILIEILGKERIMPKLCRCQAKALQAYHQQEQNRERQQRLEKLKAYSMMDEQFKHFTFENYKEDEYNSKALQVGLQYCKQWQDMKIQNIGLLLFGPPGTGKSFLSFAIANRLMENLIPVIAISSIGLLNKIKDSYSRWGKEGEVEIINTLKNAALLVLDDLGAENGTEWAKEKLYEIIDSRNRCGKPLIITMNLNREQLKQKLTSSDGVTRTYDRIVEMCIPIELQGPSKRIQAGKEKFQIFRHFMI